MVEAGLSYHGIQDTLTSPHEHLAPAGHVRVTNEPPVLYHTAALLDINDAMEDV